MAEGRTLQQQLQRRWGALQRDRALWVPHWQDISQYIQPRSGRYFTGSPLQTNGQKSVYNKIYDSTATRALRVLGAGLMGGATSPARPWFRLATPDPDLMDYEPVRLWLSTTTRNMLYMFQRSNVYRGLHNIYEELGLFGTSASFIMDDFKTGVHLYGFTAGEYALAANFKGEVDTMYREFTITVAALVGEFGLKNCSMRTQSLYNEGNYDATVTVIHAVEPRFERDLGKRDAKNMPFMSVYFEKGDNENKVLRESGFRTFRGLCPRWALRNGDVYGHSVSMEALGDVKQLQHQQLRKAEAIDYKTKPLLQVPAAYKDRELERFPGGIIPSDMTGGQSIKPAFEVNLDLNHLLMDIQDVRERVKDTFYNPLFLMLAQQDTGRMTATEVAERHEEKLLMLGPVLERLHNELLEPLVDNAFQRMIETGMVPPPPEELQGQDLNVEFVSMLAQAQRAISTNSVDRFVANLGAVAATKPEVLDKFDQDVWADRYSDMLGIDPELIVSSDKVALVRKQRAQAQQAAQQAAIADQMAGAAQKMGNTPMDQNTALDAAINQFSGYTGA